MALVEKSEAQKPQTARRKEEATPRHLRAPKGPAIFEPNALQTKEEAPSVEAKSVQLKADPWRSSMLGMGGNGHGNPLMQQIGGGKPVQLSRVGGNAWPVQKKIKVGAPDDKHEKEADAVAEKVVQSKAMTSAPPVAPVAPPSDDGSGTLQPQKLAKKRIQRKAAGAETPSVPKPVEDGLNSRKGKGSPLPPETQSQMESGIGADFSGVRVHTDSESVQMSQDLNAQAFTHGNDIYFNEGKYQPGTNDGDRLLAHELTHTVQQGASAPSAQTGAGEGVENAPKGKAQRKANKTAAEGVQKKVQRKAKDGPSVAETINTSEAATAVVQRSVISDIVDLAGMVGIDIARIADNIPGYTLFSFIIEYDILRDQTVPRDTRNLIRGLMGLIPFGNLAFEKLEEYGVIAKAVSWVDERVTSLNLTTSRLLAAASAAWDEMGITKGIDGNLAVIRNHFSPFLNDVKTFAIDAGNEFLKFVKEALLKPLVAYLDANSPAYQLATKVLGRKFPLDDAVEASTEVILEDFLKLIGKTTEVEQMKEKGTLKKAADWIDTQLARFFNLLDRFKSIVNTIWDAFSLATLQDIPKIFTQVWNDFKALLKDFLDFAIEVALKILELVKNAVLGALAAHANSVPGFHLITVILGKNPFTEEEVPRTTTNIIRGFMSLAPGGEAKFQELSATGVVPKAAGKIDALVDQLGISWDMIVGVFKGIWDSLSINDLVHPIDAFIRIVGAFGAPIAKIFTFIVEVIKILVELILGIMGLPGDILSQIVSNVMAAFDKIKNDPVQFFMNLLGAVKLGFQQFFNNFLKHLLNGLQAWLFGQLGEAGIKPPADLSLKSVLGLAMDVLGITVDNILARLALKIGADKVAKIKKVLNTLTGIWTFVRDVIERGPIAIWEYIQAKISGLWDMIVNGIQEWIMSRVIAAVTTKLLSMLDPTGIMPVINSCIAFFRAVQTFMEKLAEILQMISAFTKGVVDIANGSIGSAANHLENALAGGVPIAISFLANQVGLGKIGKKIAEMIEIARGKINEGIDWLIDKAIAAGKAILDAIFGKGKDKEPAAPDAATVTEDFGMDGASHTLTISRNAGKITVKMASLDPGPLLTKLNTERTLRKELLVRHKGEKARAVHQAVIDKLDAAEANFKTSMSNLDKQSGVLTPEKFTSNATGIAKTLATQLTNIGNTYGIKDFGQLGIKIAYDEIQGQINQLEKSISKAGTGTVFGDGHSNTAAAAEYLGWTHPTGQQHMDRNVESIRILEEAIKKLDEISAKFKLGLDTDPMYIAAKKNLEDSKKAKNTPRAYLDDKGQYVHFFDASGAPRTTPLR